MVRSGRDLRLWNHSRAARIVPVSRESLGRWSGSESTRCLRARSPGLHSVGPDRVFATPTRARSGCRFTIRPRVAEHRSASPASYPVAQGAWIMRKIATPLIVLGLLACFALPAMSAVLFTETFTYPDGNLAGNGVPAWTTFSGAGTDIQVVSGAGVGLSSNA